MPSVRKTIPLSKLNLNENNPRFPPAESQEMALKKMVDSRGEELLNMAKDIVDNGLNPSDIPIVYVNEDGNFIVKDGNRRIAALLAITKPTKIPSSSKAYIKRFKNLKARANVQALRKVPCVIFDDEDEADRWVQLKHTGANKGVGTVSWTGLMSERFKGQHRRASIELQAYNFVEDHADDALRQILADGEFPITNLGRLLGNPKFRESLGFELDNGTLMTAIPRSESLKNLTKVVSDLATKKKTVSEIYDVDQMDQYAKELTAEGYLTAIPKLSTPEPLKEEEEIEEGPPAAESKRKKEKPPTTRRQRLVPDDFSLAINDARTNNIYQELKILNADRLPNATAVLFRVFLELSLDRYITSNGVKNITLKGEMINKIKRVHDHFVDKGIMSRDEMLGVMMLCNVAGNQAIPMTSQFNGYVHNPNFSPAPGDLKVCWDNMQQFISKLWE